MTGLRSLGTIISPIFFCLAMISPALGYEEVCGLSHFPAGLFNDPSGSLEVWYGAKILLYGFFGVIFSPLVCFGWSANPIYLISLVCFWVLSPKYVKYAGLIAAVGLAIGIWGTLWTASRGLLVAGIMSDPSRICPLYLNDLYLGFWFWVAAQATIVLFSCFPSKSFQL